MSLSPTSTQYLVGGPLIYARNDIALRTEEKQTKSTKKSVLF